jgi:hypothetical protein
MTVCHCEGRSNLEGFVLKQRVKFTNSARKFSVNLLPEMFLFRQDFRLLHNPCKKAQGQERFAMT